MPQLLFFIGALFFIPLIPFLIYQGKKVKQKVPSLPEATGERIGMEVSSIEKEPVKLLLIGESSMAGVGVNDQKEGLGRQIAKQLKELKQMPVKWQILARSGYTVEMVREMLLPQIPNKIYDLIVISLGGNDTFQVNSPSKWAKGFKQLLDELRKKQLDCPIVIINMPPVDEFPAFTKLMKWSLGNLVKLHGMAVRKLVAGYEGVHFIDQRISYKIWAELKEHPAEPEAYYSDGVHPSGLTYELWAREVAAFIVDRKLV